MYTKYSKLTFKDISILTGCALSTARNTLTEIKRSTGAERLTPQHVAIYYGDTTDEILMILNA